MQDQHDVFLSYNSNDHAVVRRLANRLKDQQVNVFLDRWHLTPGQPWPEKLRTVLSSCASVAVCLGPEEMGPWQLREMYFALERQNHEPGFPVIPLLLPNANPALDFLSQNMWVDFRGGIDDQMPLSVLLSAIRRETLDPNSQQRILESINSICPYRGLHFFREQDAAFFFGRDKAVNALHEKLRQRSFVALIGASGAGKSSVVRAGLLPRLRQELHKPWEIVTMVPGDRPFYNLAAELTPLLEPESGETELLIKIGKQAQSFSEGSTQIRDALERILRKQSGTANFLLVVDQWEELYTMSQARKQYGQDKQATPDQRKTAVDRFIDGLLDACEVGILRVVITMRGDFMDPVISNRRLADQLQDAQINLGPMRTEELRQAIEEPARKLDCDFEPHLVDALLADVGNEPGNLPLLAFVLEKLWLDRTRQGGVLRFQTYLDMNRVQGALAQKADEIYTNFGVREREQLRHILLRLVHGNESTDYTRQRVAMNDLGGNIDPLIIDQLIKERLLVGNRDKQTQSNILEIAHEALISGWPLYQKWLEEDRDFLLWSGRLKMALEDWQRDKTPLSGQRLKDAQRWLQLKPKELNENERLFIRRSIRRARWSVVKDLSVAFAPLVLTLWFFVWADINFKSPEVGFYVLLSKLGIYTKQPEMVTMDCQTQACEFRMGSKVGKHDESPQSTIRFNKLFKIGRYEVTFNEYQVFAAQVEADGGCPEDHKLADIQDEGWGKENRPVINVSWDDAVCYAQWLSTKTGKSYRLPTEAEWEYAARAGTRGDYYWGARHQAQDFGWFIANSENKTHPVGGKKANAFGLYDMSGNVWEWVQDCWHEGYEDAPVDGSAWGKQYGGDCYFRVLRGGSWYGDVDFLRSANRHRYAPISRNRYVGFRLAQDIP